MSGHVEDGPEADAAMVRHLLFAGASQDEISQALRTLAPDSVAELRRQVSGVREMRERRVRSFGPPDWLFGPRETWLLCLLDRAEQTGITQALASAPELPPQGPWNEFRDLAMDLIMASSRAQLRNMMATDSRIGMPELYDLVSTIERREDAIHAESALMKSRAKWLLWVLQRSLRVGYDQALDEAPPVAKTARFPDDDPDLFANWNVLAGPVAGYFNAYDRSGDVGDLERLTTHVCGQGAGEASVSEAVSLQQAGVRWLERYIQTQEPADFAAAAGLLGSAIERFPRTHIGAAYSRCMLADLYRRRWQQAGSARDGAEASRLLARAIPELPADDRLWPNCLTQLCGLLLLRWEAEGDSHVLAEALAAIDRLCCEQRADLDTWLRGVILRLSGLLGQLNSVTSAEPWLSTVLDLVSEAVELAVTDNLSGRLAAIGMRCRDVSVRAGDSRYQAAAVTVSRSILRLLPENQEAWWSEAVQLSAALLQLADNEPDPALLDEALALLATVMSQAPGNWDARLELLQTYGAAAANKFVVTAEPKWADSGIRAAREALSLAKQQDRYVCICLVTVGQHLVAAHQSTGSPRELDEAVSLLEEAARLATEENQALVFNSLGGALTRRFGLKGDISDIDAAITAFEAATQATGPDAWRARLNLRFALVQKFVRTREPELLDAAVACAEEAVRRAPGPKANRILAQAELAGNLLERYRHNGDLADLGRCLELSEAVLRTAGHLHRKTRFGAAIVYGNALRQRHRRGGGSAADLDQAIEVLEDALPEARIDIANGPSFLRDLARAYQDRHELNGAHTDLQRGVTLYRESIESAASLDPSVALDSALILGSWSEARGAWPEAAGAYESALKAVGQLVATQAFRGHKETWLRDARTLPSRAAYALVRCGRLEEAVLALENGQALLLSEALEQGSPSLEQLRADGHGVAADRYAQADAQIPRPRDAQSIPSYGPTRQAADQEQLRSTLSGALEEIVAASGELIAPVTIREIAQAAAEAPLCYVAVSLEGGAALLVDKSATVRHIPLPALTTPAIGEHLWAYLNAYQDKRLTPQGWLAAIDEVTRWLWTALMEPVVAQDHPVLTMIPAGPLWMLPLHLAWRPADTVSGRRYALDDLLLVFAPNARVLNRASSAKAQTMLMVENPETPAAASLRYAKEEAEGVLRYFGGDRHELLRGVEATRANVLSALSKYDCLHFACHGQAQPGAPLDSALLLADAELRLSDIMTARIAARLVVLSACETAVPGITLPDEIVGLPVGFLQAGATGVIGSLWTVPDKTTATLMTRFYQIWQENGVSPAQALRRAQQQVRDEKAKTFGPAEAHPFSWGAFTYVGR